MEPASGTHSAAAPFWTTKVDSRGNFNEAFRRLAEGQCPDVVVVTEYGRNETMKYGGQMVIVEMKILISPSEMWIQLATTKKTLEMACESICP